MNNREDRRSFLAQSAVAAVALASWEAPVEAADSIPLIDTHQHLWDNKIIRPPWLGEAPQIAQPHTMELYLKEARGLGIVKTVYMEVDAAESDQVKEAELVIATCKGKKTPMKKAVISGRPGTAGFAAYARKYEHNPYIRGYRQILHPPNRERGLCLQPQFVKSIQMLGKMGKSYDICIRPAELEDACKLVDQCPGTQFVLDHCGNAEAPWGTQSPEYQTWAKGMKEISRRKNVIGKVSGVIKTCKPDKDKAEQLKPIVHHTIEVFGINRVIWASDWPVCEFTAPLKEWVAVARKLASELPARDQRKLFHDNAAKFYGI